MFWPTENAPTVGRSLWPTAFALALALAAFACSGSGDHLLGKVLSDQTPNRLDAGHDAAEGGCISQTYPGTEPQLNFYFMIDTSQAMMRDSTDARWDTFVSGFTTFLRTGAANGFGLGIDSTPAYHLDACTSRCNGNCDCVMMCGCTCNQFGDPRWPCGRELQCDATGYDEPDVEIRPLPDNIQALSDSLSRQFPFGPTVLRPALQGGLQLIARWENWHEGERAVQVLLTAGLPTHDCSSDTVTDCANAVASTSTKNYVVAFDLDKTLLDPIAVAGGGQAFAVSSQGDLVAQFTDVFRQIRASEARCEYLLPPIDPTRSIVNVEINGPLSGSSFSTNVVKQVNGRTNCDSAGLEWHYDDASRPTRIVTCRATCDLLQKSPDTTVSIAVGCQTPGL